MKSTYSKLNIKNTTIVQHKTGMVLRPVNVIFHITGLLCCTLN